MQNSFALYWATVTAAPLSVVILKETDKAAIFAILDPITNPEEYRQEGGIDMDNCYLVVQPKPYQKDQIVSHGTNFAGISKSNSKTFRQMSDIISAHFNLTTHNV